MADQPAENLAYDAERAAAAVGKRALIGITYLDDEGTIIRREQMHGTIVSADVSMGIEVALEGTRAGETRWMPPDTRPFQDAPPGEYRLRSTGEVLVDPDLSSLGSLR